MRLKQLKMIAKGAIRFSIDGPIISQAYIDARRAELLSAQRVRILEKAVEELAILSFIFSFILPVATWFLSSDFSTRLLSIIVAATSLSIIGYFSLMSEVKELLRDEFSALAPMESARCIELLRLSKTDADVDAYRRRVIAERAFTQGEYEMLVDHASRAEERAACKELYEIAV